MAGVRLLGLRTACQSAVRRICDKSARFAALNDKTPQFAGFTATPPFGMFGLVMKVIVVVPCAMQFASTDHEYYATRTHASKERRSKTSPFGHRRPPAVATIQRLTRSFLHREVVERNVSVTIYRGFCFLDTHLVKIHLSPVIRRFVGRGAVLPDHALRVTSHFQQFIA